MLIEHQWALNALCSNLGLSQTVAGTGARQYQCFHTWSVRPSRPFEIARNSTQTLLLAFQSKNFRKTKMTHKNEKMSSLQIPSRAFRLEAAFGQGRYVEVMADKSQKGFRENASGLIDLSTAM